MINTVHKIFPKAGYGTTILTDDTLRMYTSGGGHAEEKFIEKNKHTLEKFTRLWINNTPCPVCANKLISAYANVQKKPAIAAAHFYFGKKKEAALRCLAKMVKEGFTLMDFPWRWYQQYYITEPACKKDIDEALKSDEFKKKMQKMSKTVEEVYAYNAQDKTNCHS
jgi:hypothetical protein